MIIVISDLEYVEVAKDDDKIYGGVAYASANAEAYASGSFFAATFTNTRTLAISFESPFRNGTYVSASSTSTSISA